MNALETFLETQITNDLLSYQGVGGGPQKFFATVLESLLSPFSSPYPILNAATSRLHTISEKLKTERAAGNLFPWVIPRFGSLAFEGVFETCVAFWMANGQPSPPTALKPEVVSFVQAQVKTFAALVGSK